MEKREEEEKGHLHASTDLQEAPRVNVILRFFLFEILISYYPPPPGFLT